MKTILQRVKDEDKIEKSAKHNKHAIQDQKLHHPKIEVVLLRNLKNCS